MELFHPSRYGDWNAHNRWLLEQSGTNKYREIYNKLMNKTCKTCGLPITELMQHVACQASENAERSTELDTKDITMDEKKCTCGDTETQHYDDKCLVCGCKEFEEAED